MVGDLPFTPTGNIAATTVLTAVTEIANELTSLDSSVRTSFVNVLDFGAVGNGTTDDTTAINAAIATAKDVYLPAGKTFKLSANLTGFANFQKFGGPGVLKFVGAFGVLVNGGVTGVELDCVFNSSTHTGTAITINNANRVRIRRLHGVDVFNVLYITLANTVTVDWCWAIARGKGITWYGTDAARSDILFINFAVIDPASAEYGLDWDGNCHSLEVKYLGLVGGKGTIIRNTSGGSTFPAIGRFGHIEQDYSTGIGIEILAGLDYDFNMPYVLGSASDGFKIAASINSYDVRIHGGKSIGNAGYGINNLGGVLLFGAATALYSNTAGETFGSVWTMSPRFSVDAQFYSALSANNPIISFDTNDYLGYNRATNAVDFIIGGASALNLSGGAASIAGVAIPTISSTSTLTNKTLASPTLSGTVAGAASWSGQQTMTSGLVIQSVSPADLASIANAINTTGKVKGKIVYEETNGRVYVAAGASAASSWYRADGGAAIAPA